MEELNQEPTNTNPSNGREEDFILGRLDRNPSTRPPRLPSILQISIYMALTAACIVSKIPIVCNRRLFDLLIELCIDLKER